MPHSSPSRLAAFFSCWALLGTVWIVVGGLAPSVPGVGPGSILAAEGVDKAPQDKGPWADPDPTRRLGILARFEPATVTAGESTMLEVRVSTWPGWHMYAMSEKLGYPTRLDPLSKPSDWTLGAWIEPAPHPLAMPGYDRPLMTHDGKTLFRREVRIPENFSSGSFPVEGTFDYQLCDDRSCLIPTEVRYRAVLTIAPRITVDSSRQFGAATADQTLAVTPDSETELRVHIRTGAGWHIYSMSGDQPSAFPTQIQINELPEGFSWVADKGWSGPPPHPYMQPGMPPADVYEGQISFARTIKIGKDVKKGTYRINGTVSAMACDAKMCLAPSDVAVEWTITVDPEGGKPSVDYDSSK